MATIAVSHHCLYAGKDDDFQSDFIRNGDQRSSFWLFSNFIISVGANADSVMTIKFWTMGSLAGTSVGRLGPANYSSRNGLSIFSLPSIVFLMR